MNSNVRISTHYNKSMTLPKNGKKLTKMEEKSMKIALKEANICAIHPERMEAFADYLVEQIKSQNK